MKKIAAFEKAIENNRNGLKTGDISLAACRAYMSTDAKNDMIDFDGVIWDNEVAGIAETFKQNGIDEFTISSTYSGMIGTLAAFEKHGFKVAGLTEVTGQYIDIITGEPEKRPAIKIQSI